MFQQMTHGFPSRHGSANLATRSQQQSVPMSPKVLPSQPGERQRWSNLPGAGATHAIANAVRDQAGFNLVIAADNIGAEQLANELRFFLSSELPIMHLPDWETLIYDSFSPHQDIISERLEVLNQLAMADQGILVIPATT